MAENFGQSRTGRAPRPGRRPENFGRTRTGNPPTPPERPARRVERDRTDRLNDDRGGVTQDTVGRVLSPLVPGMGLALFVKEALGLDSLRPSAGGGNTQGPQGRGDEQAVRNALLGTPSEAAPVTEGGRPGTDVAGLRGRRRRLLDDSEPAAPTRRRRLLAGV